MFSTLPRHGWFVDGKGNPCKIIRSFDDRVIYLDGKRTRIASISRFNAEFEPIDAYELRRIREDVETTEHLKRLRAMRG